MLGAIIGDIVGSRFEFSNTSRADFELFTKDNDFTDDSVCTVAVADAILREKEYGDSLVLWCQRYPHPMGAYGGDSDTVGAIVGSMAEWAYGIPEEMKSTAMDYLPPDMKQVVEQFYKEYE